MGQYLEKFNDTLGKRQSQQILKSLNKKRNSGQIRTVREFSAKFEELITELQSTVLSPTLKLFFAEENAFTNSESYNFMLDSVQDDLEAAFEESNNIDKIQTSHEIIVRDVILKNLRAGVAELESKINLYEFLNGDVRGFDSAIFTTFKESKENRTERGVELTNILFSDPRANTLIGTSQDAEVELVGDRLVLSNDKKVFHKIVDIRQQFDENRAQSELVVEPAGSSLRNIIDGRKGTYWVQSLLFKEKRSFIKMVLEFDLGAVREVNFIDIDPASKYGLTMESIGYLDGNNIVVTLSGIDEQLIESEVSIRIPKIATRRVILTFRNNDFHRTQFKFNPKIEPLFYQALGQPTEGITPTRERANKDLFEITSSSKVREILGLKETDEQIFNGYEFISGLDNVRIGITTFENRSIYVSSSLEVCGAGELGLRTVESRPFRPATATIVEAGFTNQTYDNDTVNEIDDDPDPSTVTKGRVFLGSIEYWIIKQDLTAEGTLVRTNIFPILPIGVTRIHQERLLLTEKSSTTLLNNDIGTFMFFTTRNATSPGTDDGSIKVYRNGLLLTDETGVTLATSGWKAEPDNVALSGAGADLRTPNNGNRMIFKVKILAPLAGDIYTVTYNPIVSTTKAIPKTTSELSTIGGIQVVDLIGNLTARVGPEQIVLLDRIGEDDINQNSRIFLSIILRQNTAEGSITSAVEEYTLLAGCKDPTKFEGI